MRTIKANGRTVVLAEPKGGRRLQRQRPERIHAVPLESFDVVKEIVRPCMGRIALTCESGPGCPGHLVRVVMLRGKL